MENEPTDENTLDLGNVEGWPALFQNESSYSEKDLLGEVYLHTEQLLDPGSTATPYNEWNFECKERCLFPEQIFPDTDGQVEEIPFASMEITPKPNSSIEGQHIDVCSEPSTSYAISPYTIQVEETSLLRKQPWSVNTTASDGFGGTSSYQSNTDLILSKENAQKTSGALSKYFLLKTSKGKYVLKGRPMESNPGTQDHNLKCINHSVLDSNTLDSISTQSAVTLNSFMPVSNYSQRETGFSECFQLESKSSEVNMEKVHPMTKLVKNVNSNTMESSHSAMAVEFTPGHGIVHNDYEDYKLELCTNALNCPLLTLLYNRPYPGRPEQITPATFIFQEEPINNFMERKGSHFDYCHPKSQFLSSAEPPYNFRHSRSSLISAGAFAPPAEVFYNEPGNKQTLESANTISLKCENGRENISQLASPSIQHTVDLSKVQSKTYYIRTRECRLQLEAQVEELEKRNKSLRKISDRLQNIKDQWYQILERFPPHIKM